MIKHYFVLETRPVLVGLCPPCHVVTEPYIRGTACDCDCGRKYLKRRLYPCRECGGYYKTAEGLAKHEHYDWEQWL